MNCEHNLDEDETLDSQEVEYVGYIKVHNSPIVMCRRCENVFYCWVRGDIFRSFTREDLRTTSLKHHVCLFKGVL